MGSHKRAIALKVILLLSTLALMAALAACSCVGSAKEPTAPAAATPTATVAVGGVTVVPRSGAMVEPSATALPTPTLVGQGGGNAAPATATPPPAGDITRVVGGGSTGTEAAPLAPTATPAAEATATAAVDPTATPTPGATLSPTQQPTAIAGPTATPTTQATRVFSSDPTATFTPGPTATPAASATPAPATLGSIAGRVLWDGAPAAAGLILRLEDQRYSVVAETEVDAEGYYRFADLPSSAAGYNVLFAQEWNEEYDVDEAITWGWIGPVPVRGGAAVTLPDLDISLLGFQPLSPQAGTSFVAADLSPAAPIQFEWQPYPGAARYWVDLLVGAEQERVWQSPLVEDTFVRFDGALEDGTQIEPGDYWWGVGAQRPLEAYTLTVYGYLPPLKIEP
jgi:hypothetical protein